MGKMKRFFSIVLVLVMLLCGIAFQAFATEAQPVARIDATGEEYTGILPALMAATSGQTVTLLEDVNETGWVLVPADVVLDLNGKSLTAPYLSSYGTVIDSSEANTGLLSVPADRIYIRQDNTQLPVRTAEGYRFVQINKFNEAILPDGRFAFDFRPETAAHALLLTGAEASGVKVQVQVSWKETDGTRGQLFEYTDKYVNEFIGSYDAATGKYGRMFTLTLYGAEGLEDLSFQVRLQSDVSVVLCSAGVQTAPATPPATDVTTDDNGQTTEDVTVSNNTASAEVATGTQLEDGTTSLTLTTTELTEGDKNITIEDGEESRSVDVHVEGVAETNTVPVIITMKAFAPEFLNQGNLKLYHVENGTPVEMTRVGTIAEVDAHNEYYYDVITGDVVMALATFSEVTWTANTVNPWQGNYDYSWYDASKTELTIANADQLAGLSAIVGGMAKDEEGNFICTTKNSAGEDIHYDTFAGKTVKLLSSIYIGDMDSENKDAKGKALVFYPIGYYNSEGTYEKSNTAITSSFKPFMGTFDGNGNTISDFLQNTWEMKGDHNWYDAKLQYYRDGMGLFGKVYGGTVKNLTVKNFQCDGEIATAGTIAAYADAGATFENISIFNCNPRVYNIGNGGIVGCVGWYSNDKELNNVVTFKNITVDNTNKISALWGSYDVPCGGIVGQYYHTSGQSNAIDNAGIYFENCHVSAVIDVNNDVCANYQYYQYRYAGMLIGTVRECVKDEKTGNYVPNVEGITAKNCTVTYGDWNKYWYCELMANSPASYTHDFQFGRLKQIASVSDIQDENGEWNTTGNYVTVDETGKATCYHIINEGDSKNPQYKEWTHADSGWQEPDPNDPTKGTDFNGDNVVDAFDYKEDRVRYLMPFEQLISGNVGYATYKLTAFDGVQIVKEGTSVKKFVSNDVGYYENGEQVRINELFSLVVDKSTVNFNNLQVFVSPMVEGDTVTGDFTYDPHNWHNGMLTITSTMNKPVKVTITDYYYCVSEEIVLEPMAAEVGMFQQVTKLDDVTKDAENGKQYVVVAEMDGKFYALGENGTATQVHVTGEYVTDTEGVPVWTLGLDGTYTLKTTKDNVDCYLTRNKSALTQDTTVVGWALSDVEGGTDESGEAIITDYFTLSATDAAEDQTLEIAYYNGAFGVYDPAKYGEDETYSFDLYLYKYINCLHKTTTSTDAVPAKCNEVGYTAGTKCTDICKEYLTGHEEIKMTGHNWGTNVDENGNPLENAKCGNEGCDAVVRMVNGELVPLLPWTSTTSLPTEGNWYLTKDVTVSRNFNVASEGLILDLNGQIVTRNFTDGSTATPRVYTLSQNSTVDLVITDTSANETGKIELKIAEDALDDYKALSDAQRRGTLIAVMSGNLILDGGTLDGREAQCAGFGQATVFLDSGETMEMTGGMVIGGTNESEKNENNVVVDPGNGSAIYICRNAEANITSGIIVGGKAYSGAAIYAGGIVNVGGDAVVIAGIAEGPVEGTDIGATLGNSIYAGAYTKQTSGLIGSNLTISGKAKINGGITVIRGLDFVIEGTPEIKTDLNIEEYREKGYLTAHNVTSAYNLVLPQRWIESTTNSDYNINLKIDTSKLDPDMTPITIAGFTTFTETITADTDAAAKAKAEEAAKLFVRGITGQEIFVKKIDDGKYALAMGILRCANGHTTAQQCADAKCGEEIVWWEHWDYSTYLPEAGNYFLSDDVTINHPNYKTNSPVIIATGKTVRLDLNGQNITRKVPVLEQSLAYYGNHKVFTVNAGAALTITDLSNKDVANHGKISLEYPNDTYDRTAYGGLVSVHEDEGKIGKLTLCGGILDGSTVFCDGYIDKNNANDGTVCVATGAEFVMYGGKIIGMKNELTGKGANADGNVVTMTPAGSALGIMSNASATIKGGEIQGTRAGCGGAIANYGTLTIEGGTVKGGNATYGGTIYNTKTVTITGGTVTGGAADYGATINSSGTVTIEGDAVVEGGTAKNNGGTINSSGTVTITGGTVKGGTAAYGGMLYNVSGGTATISGGTVTGGKATNGGTVYNAGTLNIKHDIGTGTDTATNGGTIYNTGTLNVENGTIAGGTVTGNGGTLYNIGAVNAKGGTIAGGTATDGGTIYNTNNYSKASLTLSNGATIAAGTATNGGTIYNNGTITVNGGTVNGGKATTNGGAVYNLGGIAISGGTIEGGTAGNAGGAIYSGEGSEIIISSGMLKDGTAKNGGNIYTYGKLTITGGEITGGSATGSTNTAGLGGNICVAPSVNEVSITGGVIKNGTVSGADTAHEKKASYGDNIYFQGGCTDRDIEVGGTAEIHGGFAVYGMKSFTVSGTPKIDRELAQVDVKPNCSLNLIKSEMVMNVGSMGDDASIGFYRSGVFTTEFTSEAAARDAQEAFKGDDGIYVVAKTSSTYVLSHGNDGYTCFDCDASCADTAQLFYDATVLTRKCVHGVASGCQEENCTGNLLWETWTATDSLPSTTGNYILQDAVTVSQQTNIAKGNKVVLDLNGKNITRQVTGNGANQRVYMLEGNAADNHSELIITDTNQDGDSTTGVINVTYTTSEGQTGDSFGTIVYVQDHSKLTVYSGTLDGTGIISSADVTNHVANGIIVAANDATVFINGGTLKGMKNNDSDSGGTVIGGMGRSSITVNGGTLTAYQAGENEVAASKGGAICTVGDLTVTGGTITGGKVTKDGGAIYVNGDGILTISGGEISGGTAGANGGNINATTLTISGDETNISGGKAGANGGNINATTLTINGGEISGGTAGGNGGNIAAPTLTISGGTISGGTAGTTDEAESSYGGNLYVTKKLTINGGEISGGTAGKHGGNIYMNGVLMTITGGEIYGGKSKNTAAHFGTNIAYNHESSTQSGTAEISGDAKIDGGVTVRNVKTLTLGKTAIVYDNHNKDHAANSDLRLSNVTVIVGELGEMTIRDGNGSTYVCTLTYTEGVITGATVKISETESIKLPVSTESGDTTDPTTPTDPTT